MFKGFREFLLQGNVVDLAVAVVIGAAFTAVVTAFTEQVINPMVAAFGGGDSPGLGFYINEGNEATFVDFGAVITAFLNFLIVAAVVYFFVVVPIMKIQQYRKRNQEEEEEITEDVALLREIRDVLVNARPADPDAQGPGQHQA